MDFFEQLHPATQYHQCMVDLDFKGEDCTTNVKIGNGMMLGGSYWQSLTQKLALGGRFELENNYYDLEISL